MFGMQSTVVGASTTTACNILLSSQNPLNCELTSVSSFFVAAEAETIVFGIVEIVCCCLLLLFILLLGVWPLLSISIAPKLPYAFSAFMNEVNWITLQDRADEERRNGSFCFVCCIRVYTRKRGSTRTYKNNQLLFCIYYDFQ